MKVKELIQILSEMDPEIELYIWDSSFGPDLVEEVGRRPDSNTDTNVYIL